ncbi:Anti-sigma regulatory factor (Ser/Thr protein kinase) OS=Streptomyces griseomycini OX=66895 GN=FHS37_005034 PE=4 SV=1 [Streptomyces griseomycini]|uniref:Anti-sigma regulatory factor (Ser/Thr protein kinase) n=1 Tax=Streptomyces griseomycini TaxID=66895 RepID=A0A7W7PTE4_9ACTN|nr:anti-sigma regulatory factor (Ser/Thr protein kinase) [Streptomyces griseomycini]GGR15816.1 hypothetical protein GCM10015536_21720 [Streptomyces griseomycini]
MPENEPWEYSLRTPHDLRAVTVSRRTLHLILTVHGLIRLVDVAELLAAELVSNAVRHTKGPAALRVSWSPPGTLRIGAWDADPEPPEPPASFERVEELEEGRGLALVRACADVWGRQPLAREGNRGEYVWCEAGAAQGVGGATHPGHDSVSAIPQPLAILRVIVSNPSCNRFHEEVERRWRASRTSPPRPGCPSPRCRVS